MSAGAVVVWRGWTSEKLICICRNFSSYCWSLFCCRLLRLALWTYLWTGSTKMEVDFSLTLVLCVSVPILPRPFSLSVCPSACVCLLVCRCLSCCLWLVLYAFSCNLYTREWVDNASIGRSYSSWCCSKVALGTGSAVGLCETDALSQWLPFKSILFRAQWKYLKDESQLQIY